MSTCVILLGGELVATPRLMSQIAGARVIAADSGIDHAVALGVTPELWVGDFDSASDAAFERFADVPRETFPAEKDQTDGELALALAIRGGAMRLILAGAFGGARADHAFQHMTAGMSVAETGIEVLLTSGNQEGVPLLHGETQLDYPEGTLFSILPFSDLEDLTIAGAKWPLAERDVPFGSSLTISNVAGNGLTVHLARGRALFLAHPDTLA